MSLIMVKFSPNGKMLNSLLFDAAMDGTICYSYRTACFML